MKRTEKQTNILAESGIESPWFQTIAKTMTVGNRNRRSFDDQSRTLWNGLFKNIPASSRSDEIGNEIRKKFRSDSNAIFGTCGMNLRMKRKQFTLNIAASAVNAMTSLRSAALKNHIG